MVLSRMSLRGHVDAAYYVEWDRTKIVMGLLDRTINSMVYEDWKVSWDTVWTRG